MGIVTVHSMPEGDPFAIVADPKARARTSVAVDGSAVTIALSADGLMPCSLIFPSAVARQVFGPDFVPDAFDADGSGSAGGGA